MKNEKQTRAHLFLWLLFLALFLSCRYPPSHALEKEKTMTEEGERICVEAQVLLTSSGVTASDEREEVDDLLKEGTDYISHTLGEGWERFALRDILDIGAELFRKGIEETLSFFALMLGAGVLYTLLSVFFEGACAQQSLLAVGVSHTMDTILLFSIAKALFPYIESAMDAVRSVRDFCEGILPIFVSTNILSGMGESATFTASTFGIVLAIVEEGIEKLALPTLALLLACSLIPSAKGEVLSLGEKVYKFYLSILTLLSAIISTAFALQNAITLGVDRATLRALRYGVGSMIPIVGQTVAGTLSALSGGVLYLKSTLGVGSLIAVFTLALPPLVRLLLCRLALSLPSMIVGAMGEGAEPSFGALYRTVRRLVDTTLALVALSVALFLFVVILFMKSTVSL